MSIISVLLKVTHNSIFSTTVYKLFTPQNNYHFSFTLSLIAASIYLLLFLCKKWNFCIFGIAKFIEM